MAFKALFLAHAPDAEQEKHRCVIETPDCYKLFVVVVKDQEQAIEVCKKVVKEEDIQPILLCPGSTHRDIAEISEAVGKNVGVFVARGDGPSNRVSMEVMKREGWFSEKGKGQSFPFSDII
jgi:hypothetical protein